MIFAYTVKGYGLATEGHPQNHSALLTADQLADLAGGSASRLDDPWAAVRARHARGGGVRAAADSAARANPSRRAAADVPADLGRTPTGVGTTQAALGRTLLDVTGPPRRSARASSRSARTSARAPTSAGWVNKVGVWSHAERTDWFADDSETILHWRERPDGQHIELGIAEVNLVGRIGELGATWSRWGQPLLPIGVMYDPFVERALEPWSFGIYAGGQSILVGTPSGVTLAPEGGAHQSIKTPSIGLEQPGCISYEPAFAIDTEWTLLVGARPARQAGRRSRPTCGCPPARSTRRWPRCPPTRPPANAGDATSLPAAISCAGRERPSAHDLRHGRDGHRGARGRRPPRRAWVSTPMSSASPAPDLLFRARPGTAGLGDSARLDPRHRLPRRPGRADGDRPGRPPAHARLPAGVNGVPAAHLGVTSFGQSGDLDSVYRYHHIDTDSIIGAALDLVDERSPPEMRSRCSCGPGDRRRAQPRRRRRGPRRRTPPFGTRERGREPRDVHWHRLTAVLGVCSCSPHARRATATPAAVGAGVARKQLARQLAVSGSTLCARERGRRRPGRHKCSLSPCATANAGGDQGPSHPLRSRSKRHARSTERRQPAPPARGRGERPTQTQLAELRRRRGLPRISAAQRLGPPEKRWREPKLATGAPASRCARAWPRSTAARSQQSCTRQGWTSIHCSTGAMGGRPIGAGPAGITRRARGFDRSGRPPTCASAHARCGGGSKTAKRPTGRR